MIKEPFILLSYINTKLRDEYSSLDDFCASTGESADEINKILNDIGYFYNVGLNSFVRR